MDDDEVKIIYESIASTSDSQSIRGAMKRQQMTLMGTKASPPPKRKALSSKKSNVTSTPSAEARGPGIPASTSFSQLPGFQLASELPMEGKAASAAGPQGFRLDVESPLTSDLAAPKEAKKQQLFKKASFALPGCPSTSKGDVSIKIESALLSDLPLTSEEAKPPTKSRALKKRALTKPGGAASNPEGRSALLMLPEEVQRRILFSLPEDDIRSCFRVCRWWRDLIRDPAFMRWKKAYHRLAAEIRAADIRDSLLRDKTWSRLCLYKIPPREARDLYFQALCYRSRFAEHPGYNMAHHDSPPAAAAVSRSVPVLLVHLNILFPATARCLLPYLSRRKQWSSVGGWLREKAPKSLHPDSQQPRTWPFIAACLLLSRELSEVEWIWSDLLLRHPECRCEVTEFLYAFALILRLFTIVSPAGPWTRAHYRIIYRLRLAEFSGGVRLEQLKDRLDELAARGQQSILRYGANSSRLRLTHEQLKIARHELKPQDVIRINAFAGSGKTTTLLNFARFNPNKSFLLIVYNKAAQLHAQKIFPENVTCRTGHSLAFQAVGRRYRHKLNNLKHRDLMEILPDRSKAGGVLARRVKFVKNAIENFVSSSDAEISGDSIRVPDCSDAEREQAVKEASSVWDAMQDFDSRCPMTHDGYLKLWQLSKPSLHGYDALLIDEAQDMNPCILDVIQRQIQPKIFVGDPHQQIYAFRGSVNVLDLVKASHTYALTQSFRFGEPIAFAAQSILHSWKGEPNLLIGSAKQSTIHGDAQQSGQLTIICRNNANVFIAAHEIARSNMHSVHIIGGLDGLGVKIMLQVFYMTLPENERVGQQEVTDQFLARFAQPNGSLLNLKAYAKNADDVELSERIKVVESFGAGLPAAVQQLRSLYTGDEARAHYVVTTAHKSKGLEFRSVLLHPDLELSPDMPQEEANLLYVAATRAKDFLTPNGTLERILSRNGENFVRVAAPSWSPQFEKRTTVRTRASVRQVDPAPVMAPFFESFMPGWLHVCSAPPRREEDDWGEF